jgi:dTDP-4-amino-4,6-dideoxygalactose transaminase
MKKSPQRPDESPIGSQSQFPIWPVCDKDQRCAAERVLRSGQLNYWTGNEGRLFEREFAAAVGAAHGVAVANGTAALELALLAVGVAPADEVIVPSRTFVATAMAVARIGAVPVFADVDRLSQNVTAETIEAQLSPRTKAMIIVHLAGWPAEMDPILEIARSRRLAVVEDCAQAHGAQYKDRPVGSLGDVAAFSFCQDKIITTAGEGGMLVTNRLDVRERAWSLKDHGKGYDAVYHRKHPRGFRWLHEQIGTNWRLTEVQSAIGRVALRKLDRWVKRRRRNAAILHEQLAALPGLRTTIPAADCYHSYYKYYTFVRPERLAPDWSRDRIMGEINAAGVPCFTGSCSEVYLEQAFRPEWRPRERHPVARELADTSLTFLVHPTLKRKHLATMCKVVRKTMKLATRVGGKAARRPAA